MTRRTELLWISALIAMVGSFWAVWHGRPVSAITYAINGLTIAVLAIASALSEKRDDR